MKDVFGFLSGAVKRYGGLTNGCGLILVIRGEGDRESEVCAWREYDRAG